MDEPGGVVEDPVVDEPDGTVDGALDEPDGTVDGAVDGALDEPDGTVDGALDGAVDGAVEEDTVVELPQLLPLQHSSGKSNSPPSPQPKV